jgi:putative aminopeptidase FrvX
MEHDMSLHEKIGLLEELCATPGVSGFEEAMIRLVKREMLRYTSNVQVDRLGNVTGLLPASREGALTLMIDAHIDEIGFVVRNIRPDGFLRFYRVGHPIERVLPSTPIAIHADDGRRYFGTIGSKSHHSIPNEERDKIIPLEDLYIDAGFSSAGEVASARIRVGSPISYWPNFQVLGDMVMAKTLDNRLLVWVVLEVMERLAGKSLPVNVACVGAVQEEFSTRGGSVAAQAIHPDMALILDVTVATDTPDLIGKELPEAHLGDGVVINTFAYHPYQSLIGAVANPIMYRQIKETAHRYEIGHVVSVASRVLTDASHIQYLNGGVAVIELEIPTRYTHTPIEAARLSDAQAMVDLITHFVLDLPADFDLARG